MSSLIDFNRFKKYAVDLLNVEEHCKKDIVHNVLLFEQTWGTTSLGFGGIGGDCVTTASTIVVMTDKCIKVFFGGKPAYTIYPNEKGNYKECVYKDLINDKFAACVSDSHIYLWEDDEIKQ